MISILIPRTIAPADPIFRDGAQEIGRFLTYHTAREFADTLHKEGRSAVFVANSPWIRKRALSGLLYPIGDSFSEDLELVHAVPISRVEASDSSNDLARALGVFVDGRYMAAPLCWTLCGIIARGTSLEALRSRDWPQAIQASRQIAVATPAGDSSYPIASILSWTFGDDYVVSNPQRMAALKQILDDLAEAPVVALSEGTEGGPSEELPDIVIGVSAKQAIEVFQCRSAVEPSASGHMLLAPFDEWIAAGLQVAIPTSTLNLPSARNVARCLTNDPFKLRLGNGWWRMSDLAEIAEFEHIDLEQCPRMSTPRNHRLASAEADWAKAWNGLQADLASAAQRALERGAPAEKISGRSQEDYEAYLAELDRSLESGSGG